MGYSRAGFTEIIGVDNRPMPRYPFTFVLGDALEYVREHGREFDAIHASPPCQAYTLMRHMGKRAGDDAPDLVSATRGALVWSGRVWVMENVVGSPLMNPMTLCGSSFGLGVRRHRLFESSVLILGTACRHDPSMWPVAVWGEGRREHRGPIAVYGDHPEDSAIHRAGMDRPWGTRRAATLEVARTAMEIDWMDWRELTQAIPPAFTEFIGKQLIAALDR